MPSVCSNCKQVFADGLETCPYCGQNFSDKRCPVCGMVLQTGSTVCECGYKFHLYRTFNQQPSEVEKKPINIAKAIIIPLVVLGVGVLIFLLAILAQNTFTKYDSNQIIIGGALATIIIASIAIPIGVRERKFDANKVTFSTVWFREKYNQFCITVVKYQYNQVGKPVYTQKGDFRANFKESINDCAKTKYHIFFERSGFLKREFCDYITASGTPKRRLAYKYFLDYYNKYENQQNSKYHGIVNNEGLTPSEFFELKRRTTGDIVGVYVIYNQDKQMYYVGQAKRLYFRVNQHFTGHGNGDVYADYKFGDRFLIILMPLTKSGYDDLDKLERDMISRYDAYNSGYNRTAGNS